MWQKNVTYTVHKVKNADWHQEFLRHDWSKPDFLPDHVTNVFSMAWKCTSVKAKRHKSSWSPSAALTYSIIKWDHVSLTFKFYLKLIIYRENKFIYNK